MQLMLISQQKGDALCAIWNHLHYSKNLRNTHGGVLLLVKLHKSNTPPSFFILYKWYQIAQSVSNKDHQEFRILFCVFMCFNPLLYVVMGVVHT